MLRTWLAGGVLAVGLACGGGVPATPGPVAPPSPGVETTGPTDAPLRSSGVEGEVADPDPDLAGLSEGPPGSGPVGGPPAGTSGVRVQAVALDRGDLEDALSEVEGIDDVIGLAPKFTLRGLQGVEVTGMPAGSPIAGVGLKVGDVITRVNGHDLTSLDAALALGQTLETARTVEADVLRGGQVVRLRVDLR